MKNDVNLSIDLTGLSEREAADEGVVFDGSDDVVGQLSIYFILQRKARTYSCDVTVRRSDEARVIEYLKPRAALEVAIWSPLLSADYIKQPTEAPCLTQRKPSKLVNS